MNTWSIEGELILNCNRTVFCPCVISLGKHPPTEGYRQAWAGVRIDRGSSGDLDLSGLNVAMLLDVSPRALTDWFNALAQKHERLPRAQTLHAANDESTTRPLA